MADTKKSMWKSWKVYAVIGVIILVVIVFAKRNSDKKAIEKLAGTGATPAQLKSAAETLKSHGKVWFTIYS